jgi:DNA-binding transcriptional LysR family regulator
MVAMLLRGMGLALFTRALVQDDIQAGRLIELQVADAADDERGIALVRHISRDRLSPAAAAFTEVYREEAKKARWVTLLEGGRENPG